jgi:hypothetical protein
MRQLNDARFFNIWGQLLSKTNPGLKRSIWQGGGAEWKRERLSLSGTNYSFQVETHLVRSTARPPWELLVVNETWWDENRAAVIRSARWSRLCAGRRADVLAWLREQEKGLGMWTQAVASNHTHVMRNSQ